MSGYRKEKLGNYRLGRLLGLGSFAEVYFGEHLYLKTPAAIKILHPRFAKEALTQFVVEARAIAYLEHPHIVRLLEFGIEGDTPYMIMNYAPNGTMRQQYPKGTVLPLPKIIQYTKQIADALQYAHDHKLIHRDIKPENILLGRDGEALLSDFGLAMLSQSLRSQRRRARVGTTTYMAPEQIQGQPSQKSDQYALGIMIYEWLCGSPPFTGTNREIAAQHIQASPPSLCKRNAEIPLSFEPILMKALIKDPSQRFINVQHFAQTLEQAYRLQRPSTSPRTPTVSLKETHSAQERDLRQTSSDGLQLPTTHSESSLPSPTNHRGFPTSRRKLFPVDKREKPLAAHHHSLQPSQESSKVPTEDLSLTALRNVYLSSLEEIPTRPDLSHRVSQDLASEASHQATSSQSAGKTPSSLSRRAMVSGLIGLSVITSGAFWYMLNSSVHLSAPSLPANRVHTPPTPTNTTHPKPTSQATNTPTTTSTTQPQPVKLTVQISNIPSQISSNANLPVIVITNKPYISVKLNVIYTDSSEVYSSATQTTDSTGQVTLYWHVHGPRWPMRDIVAQVSAIAIDTDGQQSTSSAYMVAIGK